MPETDSNPWLTVEDLEKALRLHCAHATKPLRLLTTDELARTLSCSRCQINRMCDDGIIPFITIGKRRRYTFAEVREALINRQRHLGPKWLNTLSLG